MLADPRQLGSRVRFENVHAGASAVEILCTTALK
jgi:hypothetical protein